MLNRRDFLKSVGAVAAGSTLAGAFSDRAIAAQARGHVVVVGGGFGGATAAKYLRMWSDGGVRVTLVERQREFISCPISNLVVGGVRQLADITVGYDNLRDKWGVEIVHDEVVGIDVGKREIRLANGDSLTYDRAIVAPGIDFLWDDVPGLAGNEDTIPHAWKAGPQTMLLRKQLEEMPAGGVYAMHIPMAPYRCPPGPYERACVIANFLKTHKPGAKALILDANPDIQSKKGLFMKAFEERYGDIIEYRPNSRLLSVDAANRKAELEFSEVTADVLNVIPPMRAGRIVDHLGVSLINDRWVDVDYQTMEAKGAPGVHVVGDAIFPAPQMPKSGHLANQQAKVAASAVLNLLAGTPPNPSPVVMNTCYSFVDATHVVHVASVHQFDTAQHTFLPVEGAGGLSPAPTELEGQYAHAWSRNIWADMLA
ncbi:MAG TPA: FCSD flavin-binding domain-containing protein [Rhodocyclaceae bacterium]|nr:FCSD flavin-binding domain-containing protein [Rhodocyclaceae bacterium]